MEKIDIIGLGEIVVDWVAEIPLFPKLDEKIDAIRVIISRGELLLIFWF